MEPRARITPVGAVLLVLLLACVLLVALGSGTLQSIGFVFGVILLLLIAGDALPRMRFGGGRPLGGMPRLRARARRRARPPERGRRSARK